METMQRRIIKLKIKKNQKKKKKEEDKEEKKKEQVRENIKVILGPMIRKVYGYEISRITISMREKIKLRKIVVEEKNNEGKIIVNKDGII